MIHNPSAKFIPDPDPDFQQMAANFAANIAQHPERYLLSESDAAEITGAVDAFSKALRRATATGTRTKLTIMDKDAHRREAERIVRKYGNLIRVNQKIDPNDKLAIGVKERPKKLRRNVCPKRPPMLRFIGSTDETGSDGAKHILEFREALHKGQAKPEGAARIELYVELVGEDEPIPRHPGELSGGRPWYLRSFTRSPIEVEFPIPATPMLVVYWARWADSTGKVGAFSKTAVARVEGWPAAGAQLSITHRPPIVQVRRIAAICTRTNRYLDQRCDGAHLLADDREAGEMSRAMVDETEIGGLRMLVNENATAVPAPAERGELAG